MRVGSLFSGIGGIDTAFVQSGFDIVFANEFDKDACATYRKNFPSTNLIECDIRKLEANLLPDVDVLTAGFPCQPFSICGKQLGFGDERGNLFFEIMRIADVKRPNAIFLENVANLVKHDNGRTFNIICNELLKRKYNISYKVTDACDYDIPQHRTRTYITAFKSGIQLNTFRFPEKRASQRRILDVIDINSKAEEKYYLEKSSFNYQKLVRTIKDENQIYRFSDYGIQMSKDGISFTLKANMGTWPNRVPYVKDKYGIRKISPKECLALQGFPKNFVFPNISEASMYKQCGNTVCVPVVKMFADEIFKTMAG